jgi:DNA helicase-2/ATP-dependent DNA helicase PcrA
MTRAMNALILTRAHYRRRYGSDAPEQSVPSRFLEEVPSQLIENLGGRTPAWSTPGYPNTYGRRSSHSGEFTDKHYNYEDESQEVQRLSPSQRFSPKGKSAEAPGAPKSQSAEAPPQPQSIDNIARFFGGKSGLGKPGSLARPSMAIPASTGASNLKKGQRVRHAKYGEGTVLLREGDGEDAKLTVLFTRHGTKKLMERFANLAKI